MTKQPLKTNLTLKQLNYFAALAREGHFGRAAEACAITQPALSMQIQELEATLATPLVERTRAGVKLTPTGDSIAKRANKVLNDVRDLIDEAKQGTGLLNGALRIGVIPSIAPYLLPPLLPLLQKAHPKLELHIRETQTEILTKELLLGQIDVMLLALPIEHAEIQTLHLFDDHFLLAVPRRWNLSGHVTATPELLQNEKLLLLEEGHCLRDQALAYCSLQEIETLSEFAASSLTTIVEMVAADLGITLLPEICQSVERRARDISLLRFADPQPMRTIGLGWRRSSPRDKDFVELGRVLLLAREALGQFNNQATMTPGPSPKRNS